nr:heparinase II/III family protein [uncultured Mucilaginibacter sp.]
MGIIITTFGLKKSTLFGNLILIDNNFFSIANQHDYIGSNAIIPNHPRLLLFKEDEDAVKKAISANNNLSRVHQIIIKEADKMLMKTSSSDMRKQKKKLGVSRESLRKLFFLSYAWRITHDKKYLDKTSDELISVCSLDDWNPSTFLDVAEFTVGVSIAYDWVYNDMPEAYRMIVKRAILNKGLKPSLNPAYTSWLTVNHNWNQVCNTGMIYGALAIYEEDEDFAKKIINRSLTSLQISMDSYAPDGVYPEGFAYWSYGTNFNVLAIAALQKSLKNDFGLIAHAGFLQSANYFENLTGTSGKIFNYSDASSDDAIQPNGAMFWFAAQKNDPSLLWVEQHELMASPDKDIATNRLLPTVILWGTNLSDNKITQPKTDMYVGKGRNPVAMMRSSWTDPNALYIGLKAGSAANNHAHMDAASFVMDADGQRWAMDFGAESYRKLEAKISQWDYGKDSQRWGVFRYNNLAHNTISVNNSLQDINGTATITQSSTDSEFQSAVTNSTDIYGGALAKATRGVAIINRDYAAIRDEIESSSNEAAIKWTMATPATVKIVSANTAELTQNGKKLILQIQAPANLRLKTWPTYSHNYYESRNPNTIFVGFETKVAPKTKVAFTVLLIPERSINKTTTVKPISEWQHN